MGGLMDIPLSRLTVGRSGTATRVNSAGRIETVAPNTARIDYGYYTLTPNGGQDWAAQPSPNLLASPEDFATGWTAGAATVASNVAIAPDGTMTADKIVEAATHGQHLVVQTVGAPVVGQVWTLSVFAKAAERGAIALTAFGEAYAVFNLLTGTVAATGGYACSITPYGGGWYRCAVTIPRTSTSGDWYIILWHGTNLYAGDGVSGVFHWGAKVERGAATGYVPATPACRGLLVEESRTNLVSRSQDFGHSDWTKNTTTATITANSAEVAAPDGTFSAVKITTTTADLLLRRYPTNFGVYAANTTYTVSCFIHYPVGPSFTLNFNNDGWWVAAPTIAARPGWQRVSVTFTTGTTGLGDIFDIEGGAAGVAFWLWGVQLEVGAFPTSYIPTTTAPATRGGDNINMPLQQYFNPAAWTLFAEASVIGIVASADQNMLVLDNGTLSEAAMLQADHGIVRALVWNGGSPVVINGHGALAVNVLYRLALAMAADDAASSLNGAAPVADAAGALPTVTTLRIGRHPGGAYLNGHIRRAQVWPRRLTSAELQGLTAGGQQDAPPSAPATGNCLLSWVNLARRSATTITSTSAAAGLGAERLKDPQVRRRMRTLSGASSVALNIDLGTAQEVGVLALLQPDDAGWIDEDGEAVGFLDPAADTIRHRLDAVTPGAGTLYDSLYYRDVTYTGATLDLNFGAQSYREYQNGTGSGVVHGYGLHAHVLPAAVQARHWQTDIAFPSLATTPGYLDLGLPWIGPAFRPSRNFAYEWGDRWDDLSDVTEVRRSGQDFTDRGPKKRVLTFAFKALTEPEAKVAMAELGRIAGTSGQVLFIQEPNGPYQGRQAIIGRLVEVSPITQPNFALYERVFQIRQSL
ncbi:phage head spike fiber domain-containing protein [Azospirillum brasilense]|uniref:CBM-cenC domain-containing protein n=1 Tax=Azospirillum brasilense TaxID=192 RepID=A0A235H6X9_AZOBR|nr:hypothetical protein [Azospirillum brasilense]OYD80935.1 hypothetical protein CHT98_28470 [Azospirillum brasilense]